MFSFLLNSAQVLHSFDIPCGWCCAAESFLCLNRHVSNIVQFAACADNTNVALCEFLISEGADKAALAYEGPAEDAL